MTRQRHTMLDAALRLAAASIGLSLAIAGCDLRVIGIGFGGTRQTSGPEVVARLTALSYRYCPGDDITIAWDGGTQPEGCVPGASCKEATLWTDPIGIAEFSGSAPEHLFGSVTFAVGPELRFIRAHYTVQTASEERSKLIVLLPVDPVLVTQEFEFKCDPASNTWQFVAGPLVLPEGETIPEGACMATTGMESTWHNISVHHPDGGQTDFTTFQRNDTALDGFQPSELDIEVTGSFWSGEGETYTPWSSVIGQPCSQGDPPPGGLAITPESFRHLVVAYTMGCVPAEDIYDPQARAECQRRHDPETPVCTVGPFPPAVCTNPIYQSLDVDSDMQPPGENDGIIPICDLDATCGNSVCDDYCENATSCPADCQGQPTVGCGSPCASDAACAGLGPNPACAGGFCYDAQTCGGSSDGDGSTTGDDSSGGDGGGSCQDSVCGDGDCDFPACEDSMSCPVDCFE